MSKFLWVEDFEGDNFQNFAFRVFGKATGEPLKAFPADELDLREFLRERGIHLATTYAEAARYIGESTAGFDWVVLDIDLTPCGDRPGDADLVMPMLIRWHKHVVQAKDAEQSYSEAFSSMKRVAGYHLFIELVMNRGVPRDRILFCSNHAQHLLSVNNSFEPAMIEAPEIYTKDDKRLNQWVTQRSKNRYHILRRGILRTCAALLETNVSEVGLSCSSGEESDRKEIIRRNILLETLPAMLPANDVPENERCKVFRQFVRVLTQDWDVLNPGNLPEQRWCELGFDRVLQQARHWTSHDSSALSTLDEADVAFLFLIAIRCRFDLSAGVEEFEEPILGLLGERGDLNMQYLQESYRSEHLEIAKRSAELDYPERKDFPKMVNGLEKLGALKVDEQAKRLKQILWFQLPTHRLQGVPVAALKSYHETEFLRELTARIYQTSF